MTTLADALKNVRLKKVDKNDQKDFSSPKTGGFMSKESIQEYQNSVLDVNTETWLDILHEHTFPTAFCPITMEEAKLFIAIYERLYRNLDTSKVIETDWKKHLVSDEELKLQAMSDRLNKCLKEFVEDGFAFVKTSSRSAKDAPLVQERFKQLYYKELQKQIENKRGDENTKLTCLLQAAFEALKIKTADEVLDMFLRSERIYQDMLLATEQKERFLEHFVVRKFVHIDVDMEFRGFVYQGKLTSLSQYNYLIYSERLVKQRDDICKKIQDFFATHIHPKMNESLFINNYIIDFAVCEGGKIWVIEINPFLETTDGALFNWNKERHILEGDLGFVFRLTERPKPGATVMLPVGARELLQST